MSISKKYHLQSRYHHSEFLSNYFVTYKNIYNIWDVNIIEYKP